MFRIDEGQNIIIVRGDSAQFDIKVTQDDGQGGTIDYEMQEGDVLLFTVKKNTRQKEMIFQKSGQSITILPEDTENLSYGTYQYDVEFTGADGYVDTIITPHDFEVAEEVTW